VTKPTLIKWFKKQALNLLTLLKKRDSNAKEYVLHTPSGSCDRASLT